MEIRRSRTLFSMIRILACLSCAPLFAEPPEKSLKLFWWKPDDSTINFGDYLSQILIERIVQRPVETVSLLPDPWTFHPKEKIVLGIGSIIPYAEENDVIWGSGFITPSSKHLKFKQLDVRAVRGPLTRQFLLEKGIFCPEVYGDPALLFPRFFPEFKREEPIYDYIIIPNISEMFLFLPYKNVVYPTESWDEVLKQILKAKLVISGSLHGIVLAEAYGVPARLLVMDINKPLFKFYDYYQGTGRMHIRPAHSVHEALQLQGEPPPLIDLDKLLDSFPYDCIPKNRET